MKSLFYFPFLIGLICTTIQAQDAFQAFDLNDLEIGSDQVIRIPIEAQNAPFFTLALTIEPDQLNKLWYRTIINQRNHPWNTFEKDEHHTHPQKDISRLIFLPAETTWLELNLGSYAPKLGDELHPFFPNKTQPSDSQTMVRGTQNLSCPCPQPSFKGRDQWCQSQNCPTDVTPIITDVSHLIIHHSAGASTSSDWPAVVYSIWNYHVNTNGWDDIGYNWLIDPNGVIYEGRADNIQGAHFCGLNPNTMGICILGTYTDEQPEAQALESITRLFAWKSCQENINPEGLDYHPPLDEEIFTISGHMDGCATACPGDELYDLLPEIRAQIQLEMDESCGNILAPINLQAAETSSGIIQLNWSDQSDNETSFVLERKEPDSDYFYPISTLGENEESYLDETNYLDESLSYRVLAANEQDTSIYSNTITLLTTSTEELAKNQALVSIYPKVFNQFLTLKNLAEEPISISVYHVGGQSIHTEKLQSNMTYQLNTGSWSKGIYFIHYQSAELMETIKIIKP